MRKFFTNNQKGLSVVTIILVLVGLVILGNVLYGIYMAYAIYTNKVPYSVATGGFGGDDELIDIDVHLGKKHRYKSYPYYGHKTYDKKSDSSFGKRFASKKQGSSFASRFKSKYGRSRTSGFRLSGFLGGK